MLKGVTTSGHRGAFSRPLGGAPTCLHVGEGDVVASASLRNATSQANGAADSLACPAAHRISTNPSVRFRSANVRINLARVRSYGWRISFLWRLDVGASGRVVPVSPLTNPRVRAFGTLSGPGNPFRGNVHPDRRAALETQSSPCHFVQRANWHGQAPQYRPGWASSRSEWKPDVPDMQLYPLYGPVP